MGRSGRQDDRQTPRSPDTLANVKTEEKHVRRSSVKKIEKMKEKVGGQEGRWGEEGRGVVLWQRNLFTIWQPESPEGETQ